MEKTVRLPNTVVIGAPKSGTTSLYHYLRQHPEVFLPRQKELHFFSYDLLAQNIQGPGDENALHPVCRTKQEYLAHFQGVADEKVVAEVSPSYLYFCQVSERILAELGLVKIIAILRDPVEKAFSQYMHLVRANRETLPFYAALQAEEERRAAGWGDMWRYAESSLYAARLRRYIELFGRQQVQIILAEEFFAQPAKVMQDLFDFLGVDPTFSPKISEAYNRSGAPRSRFVADLFVRQNPLRALARKLLPAAIRQALHSTVMNLNVGPKGKMDEEARVYLQDYFHQDILEVEEIIGRSTGWLRSSEGRTFEAEGKGGSPAPPLVLDRQSQRLTGGDSTIPAERK